MKKQSMKRSLFTVLSVVALSTSLTGIASAASNDAPVAVSPAHAVTPSVVTPTADAPVAVTPTESSYTDQVTGITIDANVPIVGVEVKDLTAEEYAKLTGKSLAQLQPQQQNSAATANYVYKEYGFIISLGGKMQARAGVPVQLEELLIGTTHVYRINAIDSNNAYLNAYNGGSFNVVKNYASVFTESDTQFNLSVSGYSETAVQNDVSIETGYTIGELVTFGWSVSYTNSTTTYYRKQFQASQTFNVN